MKFLSKFIMFFILGIRPLLGPPNTTCRYPITCTEFAQEQLEQKSFFVAIWLIFKRVLSCNPLFNKF